MKRYLARWAILTICLTPAAFIAGAVQALTQISWVGVYLMAISTLLFILALTASEILYRRERSDDEGGS